MSAPRKRAAKQAPARKTSLRSVEITVEGNSQCDGIDAGVMLTRCLELALAGKSAKLSGGGYTGIVKVSR